MAIASSPGCVRCVVRLLPDGPDLTTAIAAFAARPLPAILESAAAASGTSRISILAAEPVEILEVPAGTPGDPLASLAERFGRGLAGAPDHGLPFAGGWIGYVAYEAGLGAERIVPRLPTAASFPWVRFGLYDTAALYDHDGDQWFLVAVDLPGRAGARADASARVESLATLLLGSPRPPSRTPHVEDPSWRASGGPWVRKASMPDDVRTPPAPQDAATREPRPDWTWDEYAAKVTAAKDYIAAGDVYQVNLTQRFVAQTAALPIDLYMSLRRQNPAEYAAFLGWPDRAILSSSPELFLEVRGRQVRTRPIKGTRPRTGDPVLDAIRRDELAASPKDRAELNMIIDLLRNDLGKVCAIGSVRVDSAGDIEEHPTVFHRVATICGRLRPDCSAVDLVRAAFPGGSVTGAPKIRAMQIIEELETIQRGIYCGAIGYFGLDGAACFNVAIRTMMQEQGRAHFSAGGAITADSDAEDEYEELHAKAEGMFRALRAFNEGSRGGAEAQRIL